MVVMVVFFLFFLGGGIWPGPGLTFVIESSENEWKWICDQHVTRIATTEGGGVIGDKVTLIFRSFSTHFFTSSIMPAI